MIHKRRAIPAAANDQKRDFRREDGHDELLSALHNARSTFQCAMLMEAASLAESLNPDWRLAGRKILGIEDGQLLPPDESRIATMKMVIDGDHYAMFALAREMVMDDEVEGTMRVYAGALVSMHSIVALKLHAIEPSKGAGEKELMEALECISSPLAALLADDLAIIARRSPYENVRSVAKAMIDHADS